ncbi:HmuY family protein [Pseudopedobacter beijingensis]|uniref:HmuY family protein n=1 Tax=Pseudopedobacter beijingensis TaxID=1207056 RepID=A0ABW4IEN3_9SPHI
MSNKVRIICFFYISLKKAFSSLDSYFFIGAKLKAFSPFRGCFILIIFPFILSGCKKKDSEPLLEDGKSTVIYDLAGDTGSAMGNNGEGKDKRDFKFFLFRLKDKKQIWLRNEVDSTQYLKTKDWDIAFTGPYNSELYINNGSYEFNPGFGGPATGTVVKVNKPYSEVDTAPSDEEFNQSNVNKIGWASDNEQNGWFYYSMNSHIMVAIKNRTYLIHLPDGKYAKLEILNAYQGNPPSVTDLNWPAPYYTFRYFVQENGSKDLRTR